MIFSARLLDLSATFKQPDWCVHQLVQVLNSGISTVLGGIVTENKIRPEVVVFDDSRTSCSSGY